MVLESLEARIVVHDKNETVYEEDIAFLKQVEYPRKSQSPRDNRRNWNGMMTQKLGNGFEFIKKACFVCGSFNHLIKDCDFYDKEMVEKPVLNNKGKGTGQREIRLQLQQSQDKCQLMLLSKALQEQVNNVTTTGPKVVVSAAEGNGENTVKSLACWIWRPTRNVIDYNSKDSGSCILKRFDYVDLQGRLKSIDGEFVAFGESPKGGKITRKGKIGTGKLDFEDVYFIKELKFNLFSVPQMCDKKNSILFTKTECLVLSPDFKLLDESQQNGVAERKNRTLIEAARTILEDLLLPTTFWAEAVSTACYVQNRVLVTKPHNKTPYELLHGRPPSISFMRPFGCPVTILNTLDPLGKFDGKVDEGFFVGYSINSKAFRVFNTRTRKVEENLHITFLENKPNVTGSGIDWLFDIDLLTNSMNYEPVTAGNQTNKNAGIKDNVDAVPTQQYILLPLLYDSPQSSKDAVADDAGKKTNEEPANEGERNGQEKEGGASNKEDDQNVQDFRVTLDNLLVQQKKGYANSTNRDSTVSPSVSTAGQSFTNADDLPTDPLMPDLEDTADLQVTGIFSGAYDDEDVGAEADLNNLETTMSVSPIPTTRIHKDHPKEQIIRDINSATQTRRMIKMSEEHAMINPSWIEAMQDELLQFSLQKVWRLVDLPKGKHAIGTKWMDVKSTFLYGTIEEEVYVCQPLGFKDLQFPGKVYKVEKALYGLHQAPRAWYETLSTYLLENGFRRGAIDKTNSSRRTKVMQRDDGIFISQDKFQVTPKTSHLHVVKMISRYLKGHPKLGLWYPRDSLFDLEAFSDYDYAGASLDRKSTTGGCQFLGKRLISWKCKKQTIVANPTTKVEYVAAANCCRQIFSQRLLMLADLTFWFLALDYLISEDVFVKVMIDEA
ncbi:putative ribonuclease H-like domain-containing protein [Tanacetum coccineum]